MRRDVLVQAVDLALGEWREDYTHKVSLFLGHGAARLDAPEDRVARNSLCRVGQIFLMPRHDFFTKPALHCRVTLQQGAHTVAHDFADGEA